MSIMWPVLPAPFLNFAIEWQNCKMGTRPEDISLPPHYKKTILSDGFFIMWHRAIFPQNSIVTAAGLNFCVRDGNRCDPSAMGTTFWLFYQPESVSAKPKTSWLPGTLLRHQRSLAPSQYYHTAQSLVVNSSYRTRVKHPKTFRFWDFPKSEVH